MTPWFQSWFDSVHYHRLYAYRDDREAASFIDALIRRLRPADRSAVLDLGCGAGRHSKHLASMGFRVTGIDLAAGSIREARRSHLQGLRFFQHDMRAPFGRESFDCVFSFFTSFGYFENPADDLRVVRNIARALKDGGRLVLDYLNAPYAQARLVPDETRRIDDVTYRITRWTDARHFFKRIQVEDGCAGPVAFLERVARFTLEDFERMFALHDLRLEQVYGDYRLNPYEARTSSRLILVARRLPRAYFRERCFRTRLSVSGVTPRYDASIL